MRRTAPRHIHRRMVTEYVAVYKAGKKGKGKGQVIVSTLFKPPPKKREFRLAGATPRTFTRTQLKHRTKEIVLVMPTKTKDKKSEKAKTKSRKKTAEEETDEELEDIAEDVDLDDVELDDEDETSDESTDDTDDDEADDAEDEDDDDEEVEKPKSKKKKKAGSRASNNGKIGTQEIAEAAEVDARTLRMVLRKHEVEKDDETGRYEWDSLEDPTVKKILKWIEKGEAADIKKASLDKLKEKKAAEKKSKKGKKGKKKKKEAEDEDDE